MNLIRSSIQATIKIFENINKDTIAWLNFITLVISSFLFTYYYVKSVSPTSLEKRIGPKAWDGRCSWYRIVASHYMFVCSGNYILYHWYPLPIAMIPEEFPWKYKNSLIMAISIFIPSFSLMTIGCWYAGEETLIPKKEHEMYNRGIYNYIRHPQALGEMPLWWVIAFSMNSPFLVLFSFVYVPVFIYFCIAEENDLMLRYGKSYENYKKRVGFLFPKMDCFTMKTKLN